MTKGLQDILMAELIPIIAEGMWNEKITFDDVMHNPDERNSQLAHAADRAAGRAITVIQKRLEERFVSQLREQLW